MKIKNLMQRISVIQKSVLVKDIMSRDVISLDKNDTVFKAIEIMGNKSISTVVILDRKKPTGIVTERDLVKKILLKEKNPRKIKLSDIMTRSPKTINLDASIRKASNIMKTKKVRQLIVINEKGNTVGLISQTDIIKSMNRIYKNYKSLLWDPWVPFLFFVLISLLFLLNILLFRK
jgi:CBS domain-containing protein